MKITNQGQEFTKRHGFSVLLDGETYAVSIWLNEKGEFIDESVKLNDVEFSGEGEEGDIRERIVDELANKWEK